MGRIHILPDHVANQIAAGEVVDRPASVVKELLENSLDAGATHIRVEIEAGGRKLIRITDNGCGMVRDDALLAFERHATSKLRTANDLLSIATLGFRGEALPSIASVCRMRLETSFATSPATSPATGPAEETSANTPGTDIEIAGGKILRVADAALPSGTRITIEDLFFNVPARRKFLRAESTELSHVTALVTHYALVHPDKHFELHSATRTLLQAPPVARAAERIYQIFGADTLAQLLPVAAERALDHSGLPAPPPWKVAPDAPAPQPGHLRLTGFYSKPELQKLNRNSIYIFINKRLIRDRLLLHAISEAYRNIIPPTSFPVVLLFLEMPPEEVDVNVHPAKTEVRFRQQSLVHDFVRDSLRSALMQSRPAAAFLSALDAAPLASPSLIPVPVSHLPGVPDTEPIDPTQAETLTIGPVGSPVRGPVGGQDRAPQPHDFRAPASGLPGQLSPEMGFPIPFSRSDWTDAASRLFAPTAAGAPIPGCDSVQPQDQPRTPDGLPAQDSLAAAAQAVEADSAQATLAALATLRPLGQLRDSFILAVNDDGLWIIDQHVAHERVLFEKILRSRDVEAVQRQRLLMPALVELQPHQMVVFAEIAEELENNGFEAEPFGPRTLAVKAVPVGLEGRQLERMLAQVIDQAAHPDTVVGRREDMGTLRGRIAASIACHAAIKVNTPLEGQKMAWLLDELAKTSHPTSCPHGRPIALRYSWREIQRAFQRI